ncbi:50S ribosomal protein L11 methyltransferase [Flavobacteriaceae bacterium Ap0902]|nr:50S ribosomal protein L11 methyltransferase [Flavobacteriaceae bacterium Ap0902]
MNYVEYSFIINPPSPWTEILMAKLSLIEFESFDENEIGVKGYILKDFDDEDFVKEQISQLEQVQISYEKTDVEQVNWNLEWEKHFNPIQIGNECYIRATFHEPKPEVDYEIIIQPKMSFGTGHHETTHLMVQFLLEEDVTGKSVLDMGTGTGILAILAKLKGADLVEGIDIDEWSYENAIENAEKNKVDATFYKGGAERIPDRKYDIVLANINKNILIEDIPFYVNALKKNGILFLSGLYNFDGDDIKKEAFKYGLEFIQLKERNEWISLKFMLK